MHDTVQFMLVPSRDDKAFMADRPEKEIWRIFAIEFDSSLTLEFTNCLRIHIFQVDSFGKIGRRRMKLAVSGQN